MVDIHTAAFGRPNAHGWTKEALDAAQQSAQYLLVHHADAYALARPIGAEAELLLIAVHPSAQRQGTGSRCFLDLLARLSDIGVTTAFLEVAADNAPALAFYRKHGFAEIDRRANYYATPAGPTDAVILQAQLHAQNERA